MRLSCFERAITFSRENGDAVAQSMCADEIDVSISSQISRKQKDRHTSGGNHRMIFKITIAPVEQNPDRAEIGIRNNQIGKPVSIEIGSRNPGRFSQHKMLRAGIEKSVSII